MNNRELCNRKYDYSWTVMIQLNARMDRLEGIADPSALSPETFIMLSQAFRKALDDDN
jgi:hypothetical protein